MVSDNAQAVIVTYHPGVLMIVKSQSGAVIVASPSCSSSLNHRHDNEYEVAYMPVQQVGQHGLDPALPAIRCATKEEAFTEARKRVDAEG